jgi:two-component system cell cycle response regulator
MAELEMPGGRVAEVGAAHVDWQGTPATLVTIRDVTERLRTQHSLVVLAEELRTANSQLRLLAEVDPLTGLLNRRGLKRVLDADLFPRLRLGWDLVAIMVDCDEFKAVNDTYDHVAGDLVLRQVGERIRSVLRPGDPLARVGGDEFLILLPGARHADALRVANRIRDVVAGSRFPIPYPQSEVALTVSVGVAQIPRHVRDADDIVSRADARLRQSKLAGKNRVTGPAGVAIEGSAPA